VETLTDEEHGEQSVMNGGEVAEQVEETIPAGGNALLELIVVDCGEGLIELTEDLFPGFERSGGEELFVCHVLPAVTGLEMRCLDAGGGARMRKIPSGQERVVTLQYFWLGNSRQGVPKFLHPGLRGRAYTQLKAGCRNLDAREHSFRTLMLEHQSMVFSIALRILGDRFLAEETAQDVFLELHGKLGELESDEHVVHWLRRVAVHRSIDRIRQRDRRPEDVTDPGELPEVVVEAAPGDPLLSRQVRQVVASLPVTPRTVVVLRYQEDMSVEEIAEALSMPVATVKSHLRRTLQLLREKMTRVVH
jgi:RNA polymerase sigma-70 factor (ECF subfamily)